MPRHRQTADEFFAAPKKRPLTMAERIAIFEGGNVREGSPFARLDPKQTPKTPTVRPSLNQEAEAFIARQGFAPEGLGLDALPSRTREGTVPKTPAVDELFPDRLGQAKVPFVEAIRVLDAFQETGQGFVPAPIQAAVRPAFEHLFLGRQPFTNDEAKERFQRDVETNKRINTQSRAVLKELVTGGMSLREAELALAEDLNQRPLSAQLAGSFFDPLEAFTVAKLGLTGIRALGAAPDAAGTARTLLRSQRGGIGRSPEELEDLIRVSDNELERAIAAKDDIAQFKAGGENNQLRSELALVQGQAGEAPTFSPSTATDVPSATTARDDAAQITAGGNRLEDVIDKPIHGVDEIPNADPENPASLIGEVGTGGVPPTGPPTSLAEDPPFDPDDSLAWFRRYIADPERALEAGFSREAQSRARAAMGVDYTQRLNELRAQGMSAEDAFNQAGIEKLTGSLPIVPTDLSISEIFSPMVRDALFEKIRQFDWSQVRNGDLEQRGTVEALTNALGISAGDGKWIVRPKAIPDKPGIAGGSAMTRLQRVFGDEIPAALDNNLSLNEIIAFGQPSSSPEAIARNRAARERGLAGSDITPEFGPRPLDARFGELTQQPLDDSLRGALDPSREPITLNQPAREFSSLPREFNTPTERTLYNLAFKQFTENPGQFNLTPEDITRISRLGEREFYQEIQRLAPKHDFIEHPPLGFGETTQQALDPSAAFGLDEPQIPLGGLNEPSRPHRSISPEDQLEQNKEFVRWVKAEDRRAMSDMDVVRDGMKQVGLGTLDFFNGLRSFKSAFDASWLRQNVGLIVTDLDSFRRGWGAFFKSLRSETIAKQMDRVRKDKRVFTKYYEDSGKDFLRPLDGPEASNWQQAEEFPGRLGTRPIQKAFGKIPGLNASGRAHISALNESTWNIYEKAAISYEKYNAAITSGDKKFMHKFVWSRNNPIPMVRKVSIERLNIQKELNALADVLGDMTGRGHVPQHLKGLTPVLNAGFFSLRNNIGRVMTPVDLFRGTARSRKFAWQRVSATIGTFSAVLFMGERVGLWEVETDIRSADFMKIRVGKIRIDPWGGYQQFVVFIARNMPEGDTVLGVPNPLPGGIKSSTTGEVRSTDLPETGQRLLLGKGSPLTSLMVEANTGKTFTGETVDLKDLDQWLDRTLSFSINDFREVYLSEGWKGTALGVPGIVGAGLIVYDLPRWEDLDVYYQMKGNSPDSEDYDPTQPKTTTTALHKEFRKQNPLQDARLFVRGQVTTLQSQPAVAHVLDIMREHKVDPEDVKGYKKIFGDSPVPTSNEIEPRQTADEFFAAPSGVESPIRPSADEFFAAPSGVSP